MKYIKIESFEVSHQIYLIPTIKVTHSKILDGHYGISIIWLDIGLELKIK